MIMEEEKTLVTESAAAGLAINTNVTLPTLAMDTQNYTPRYTEGDL